MGLFKFETQTFDVSKHPRGEHGRFSSSPTSGGFSSVQRAGWGHGSKAEQAAFNDRWTQAKGGRAWGVGRSAVPQGSAPASWQSLGAKIPGIPVAYTGSKNSSPRVDGGSTFKHIKMTHQIPKGLSKEDHEDLKSKLYTLVQILRQPTVERGVENKAIPADTDKRTINRAYNHAALLALHDYGTVDYDFSMDDKLKDELRPLVPFMRYARRRVKDTLLSHKETKGRWGAYRKEFGLPFADKRKHKVTGEIRLRTRPNQEFIKDGSVYGDEEALEKGIWRVIGQHAKDIITRPTAIGKKPAWVHIKRDLVRANLRGRERLITTDAKGVVTSRTTGGKTSVKPQGKLQRNQVVRTYHNHPGDDTGIPSGMDHAFIEDNASKPQYKPHIIVSPYSKVVAHYRGTYDIDPHGSVRQHGYKTLHYHGDEARYKTAVKLGFQPIKKSWADDFLAKGLFGQFAVQAIEAASKYGAAAMESAPGQAIAAMGAKAIQGATAFGQEMFSAPSSLASNPEAYGAGAVGSRIGRMAGMQGEYIGRKLGYGAANLTGVAGTGLVVGHAIRGAANLAGISNASSVPGANPGSGNVANNGNSATNSNGSGKWVPRSRSALSGMRVGGIPNLNKSLVNFIHMASDASNAFPSEVVSHTIKHGINTVKHIGSKLGVKAVGRAAKQISRKIKVPNLDMGKLSKAYEESKHKRDDHGRWSAGKVGAVTAGAYTAGSLGFRYGGDIVSAITGRAPEAPSNAKREVLRTAASAEWRAGPGHAQIKGFYGEGTPKQRFAAGMQGSHTIVKHIQDAAENRTGFKGNANTNMGGMFGNVLSRMFDDDAKPAPKSIWRGTNNGAAKAFLHAKAGDEVTYHAPSSWTRDPNVASHFARYNYAGKSKIKRPKFGRGFINRMVDAIGEAEDRMKAAGPRAGDQLSAMVNGPNVDPNTPKVRVHLRGLNDDTHMFDVEGSSGIPGPQAEIGLGAGSKVRVDKVRGVKGTPHKVVFATLIGQDAKAAMRRGVGRRLLDPIFHAGRMTGRIPGALVYGGLAAGGAWAFRSKHPKVIKLAKGSFDPSKHPRNKGKFTNKNGTFALRGAVSGALIGASIVGRRVATEGIHSELNRLAQKRPGRMKRSPKQPEFDASIAIKKPVPNAKFHPGIGWVDHDDKSHITLPFKSTPKPSNNRGPAEVKSFSEAIDARKDLSDEEKIKIFRRMYNRNAGVVGRIGAYFERDAVRDSTKHIGRGALIGALVGAYLGSRVRKPPVQKLSKSYKFDYSTHEGMPNMHPAAHAMLPNSHKHLVHPDFSPTPHTSIWGHENMAPQVAAIMPEVNAISLKGRPRRNIRSFNRHANTQSVSDPKTRLSNLI